MYEVIDLKNQTDFFDGMTFQTYEEAAYALEDYCEWTNEKKKDFKIEEL